MKTQNTTTLTKFDRQVIMEAYQRNPALRNHTPGWAEQLAKETGYRAEWLLKHAKEVQSI